MTLGLFPAFSLTNYGGLEESALIASQVVRSRNAPDRKASPQILCYGRDLSPDARSCGVPVLCASSRLGAVCKVLQHRWSGETLLVWHIHLLKLLPLFRLPRAKVLLFLHGIEVWQPQGWYLSRLLKRVDAILANSQHTWSRFVAANPAAAAKPHKIVHLGVGEPIVGSPPAPLEDRAVALMLGRMDRREDYKGHREMIGSWPAVIARIPDAELWIVGDGSLRPELERVAHDSSVRDRIRFLGRVSPERKQELLGQCRCLALPSRGEGFGLVYLEAMRVGRPCLVSTVDSGREVVDPPEAGLAVNPDHSEELTDATCRLLTLGPAWDSVSNQARRRYEGRFTASAFRQRLQQALLEAGH